MTSERQIAANRRNSRRSCGPRSAAGKAIASRNALQHGLAAITHSGPRLSSDIEPVASDLCGDDADPLLFEQALIIAGNERVLRLIRGQRVAVIERLHDIQAIALAKGDNSLRLGRALLRRMKDPVFDEINSLHEKVSKQWRENPTAPHEEDNWTVDLQLANKQFKERDEFEAVEEAASDLLRLERYYRRTWSRQKRAIRNFTNIKLMRALGNAVKPQPLPLNRTDAS